MQPGSIVQCRNRHWVLLPDEDPERFALRPLTGAADELTYIHKRLSQLIGYDLPGERLTSGVFPAPKGDELGDAVSTRLLWQAARLSLREGATPFRSLGKISIRPRTYQFVPLLMALRLDPVRLLIADDVGVGKTVEALLIVRELLERRIIRRFAVLCLPHLCDQWQKELAEKFNLDSVVIRSGTVGQLDRQKPQDKSIYQHFRVQVVSIDFAKTKNNSARFIQDCPRLVIVDESHGAAESERATQQQRHKLLRALAADNERHLILLTATPHSGVENAFRSLLGLLKPEFANYETGRLNDEQRAHLARHFVQRTRRNIEDDWENDHCFPKRLASDETYPLSPEYRALFERTYAFCAELIRAGESLTERKQRVHYWTALALLRCIMSSPAAAVATLAKRAGYSKSSRHPLNPK